MDSWCWLCRKFSFWIGHLKGIGYGLVHLFVHSFEAHGALDDTVDAQLVIQHPAGALVGRNARDDFHILIEQLSLLLLGQVHLEGNFVLDAVEDLQQTPGPDDSDDSTFLDSEWDTY